MKKLLLVFLLGLFFCLPTPTLAADCGSVFLEPGTTIDGNYNGKVTITTEKDCFGADAAYMMIAAPKTTDDKTNFLGYSAYNSEGIVNLYVKPDASNPTKVIASDFDFGRRSKDKDELWIIKVCLSQTPDTKNCTNQNASSILLNASFTLGPKAATPGIITGAPQDQTNLPTINIEKQQCTFQYGSSTPVTIHVQNTIPGKFYNWESGDSSGTVDAGDEGAIFFTIPNPEEPNTKIKTGGPGETRFCIDQYEYGMRRVPDKNCVTLSFTGTAPDPAKAICDPTTRGPKTETCGADKISYCKKLTGTTACPTAESCTCSKGECVPLSRSAGQIGTQFGCKEREIKTAIGCVPIDPAPLMAGLIKYVVGISGGIALLLMIFGSFQMITSAGNAETLKKGREQFVSAVIGLLFVIFAVLLMQIVGVDILGLPGFS